MNWSAIHDFAARCTAAGIEPPEPITRAIHLLQVAAAQEPAPTGGLLALDDAGVAARVEAYAIRAHHAQGYGPGLAVGVVRFQDELVAETREACLPDLERIVTDLQPTFDELAAPLVTAARDFGFTYATTSDHVIDMADEKASAAWRAVPRAWRAIAPIVSLRIAMSTAFGVSPTMDERRAHAFPKLPGATSPNYSVCFAAGDNWSFDDGYYIEGKTVGHLDWLALAAGGLRLNSPAEVRAKLDAGTAR